MQFLIALGTTAFISYAVFFALGIILGFSILLVQGTIRATWNRITQWRTENFHM